MKKIILLITLVVSAVLGASLKPDAGYTYSCWQNGWRKLPVDQSHDIFGIETSEYGFTLDVDAFSNVGFGKLDNPVGYEQALNHKGQKLKDLPPAKLQIELEVDGVKYVANTCKAGIEKDVKRLSSARLWESARYVQHFDFLELELRDKNGNKLPCDAALDLVAWPDNLTFNLKAQPAYLYGDGTHAGVSAQGLCVIEKPLKVEHAPDIDAAEFSLECWVKVPKKLQAGNRHPWILCKNRNEAFNGNFGFMLNRNDQFSAHMNIGGGRDNQYEITQRIRHDRIKEWNHLVLTYDGKTMKFYLNGRKAGEKLIDKPRKPGALPMMIGGRADGHGKPASVVIDQVRIWNRPLAAAQVKAHFEKPETMGDKAGLVLNRDFEDLPKTDISEPLWKDAVMRLSFETGVGKWNIEQKVSGAWKMDDEKTLSLSCNIDDSVKKPEVQVSVSTTKGGSFPVGFDKSKNCYVSLVRQLERDWKTGYTDIRNYDEFKITVQSLSNKSSDNFIGAVVPRRGFWQRLFKKDNPKSKIRNPKSISHVPFLLDMRPPANVTGLCPILCDEEGCPTGIPVQLSKNWHNSEMGGYLMAYTKLPVEAGKTATYTLRIAYGFYGSLPSASHSQLSLVGYSNSNGRWDQLAIGCWGETICFDMDMSCVDVIITDIRMLMARNGKEGTKWSWTDAGWGGDWLMIKDEKQSKYLPKEMKTAYVSQGPCLTDVRHSGYYGQNREIGFEAQIKTLRTDDYSRSFQRLDYKFTKDVSAEKIWLFKTGRTHHHATPKIAYGNADGLIKELAVPATLKKGDIFLDNVQLEGPGPWWVAIPGAHCTNGKDWGTGYRAIIIRDFKASMGEKKYDSPAINVPVYTANPSNLDIEIVPPAGIKKFSKGDSIQMDVEFITLPRVADDYYGANEIFRKHLADNPCSWKTVYREVKGNRLDVKVTGGSLLESYPIIIQAEKPEVNVKIAGGVGKVPIRFEGLKTADGYALYQIVDGKEIKLDQSVHGNDFWQTDYDAATDSYKLTYNLPLDDLPQSEWVLK